MTSQIHTLDDVLSARISPNVTITNTRLPRSKQYPPALPVKTVKAGAHHSSPREQR